MPYWLLLSLLWYVIDLRNELIGMLLSEIVLCSSLSTKYCPGGTSDEKLVFNLENDNI